MLIPLEFLTKKRGLLSSTDYEVSFEHAKFTERLRKTLYYGKTPNTDRPSLPVTELAVGFFTDAAPRELGRVDLSLAADMSHQACISPCSMMLGLIYVDRLKHRNPDYLQQVSSSDLFLISMMMASKYLYDEGVDEEVYNDEWAESADMDVEDVNTLERAFLKAIDWQLYVQQSEFFDLLKRIERRVARDKGRERGFYSYSDLVVLSGDESMNRALRAIVHQICKLMIVCSMAYVAGVLTMVVSTMSLVCVQQALPVYSPIPGLPVPAITTTTTHHLPTLPLSQQTGRETWNAESNGSLDKSDRSWRSADDVELGASMLQRRWRSVADALGMSGLLTLAFLKDAVVQFVAAVTMTPAAVTSGGRAESEVGAAASDRVFLRGAVRQGNDGQNVVCTCGCCVRSGDWRQGCINVSVDSHGGVDSTLHGHVGDRNTRWWTTGDTWLRTTGDRWWTTGDKHGTTGDKHGTTVDTHGTNGGMHRTIGDIGHTTMDTWQTTGNVQWTTEDNTWLRNGLSGSNLRRCAWAVKAQCCCRTNTHKRTFAGLRSKVLHADLPFHNVVLGFGTTADAVVAG